MLSFLVTAPGLKHLDIKGQIDNSGFPLARLKEEWQGPINACPHKQTSQLIYKDILFKLAAIGDLSNRRILSFEDTCDPVNLVKIAGLFPDLARLFIDPNPIGQP
ncbi:hypothetical protein N7448_005766 [Penicillium atrosanguineum]|uniref:Uncharacterized protein n=1 Tax=Penicillium atrosanguineum TaxID=1132637 RepID=A0A9W9GX81_9EURO|nr:uncharacterized protein N7443_009529 [Penicillium atrosanguineum]KAJ5131608.1 hypothetical protein N7448_005766 [Penicillium atrosanguineum]KAJ5138187.1 hypothetical protein N7526_004420 [Penicillium atrosanguineum]KAJ5289276.1 hypothetical protein N7443_009529 [Penicillium atrosanguineum]KAJ5307089.1 hypothetical protein N7476_007745 [Penicillium atrosanguineum]